MFVTLSNLQLLADTRYPTLLGHKGQKTKPTIKESHVRVLHIGLQVILKKVFITDGR